MSIFAVVFPAEAAAPVMAAVLSQGANVLRPLLGLGVFAAFLFLFRPLLVGILRAALMLLAPRKSLQERKLKHRLQSVTMLNRMAREYDGIEPGLAAEIRSLVARG